MRISVIGSGYVGLVAAACFAELGHRVVCVDNDHGKVEALNAGQTPIYEDYLTELLGRHRNENLAFSTSLSQSVRGAQVVFIAVGTPMSASGDADLSFVESVTRELAKSINGY